MLTDFQNSLLIIVGRRHSLEGIPQPRHISVLLNHFQNLVNFSRFHSRLIP